MMLVRRPEVWKQKKVLLEEVKVSKLTSNQKSRQVHFLAERADEREETDRRCTNEQSFCRRRGFFKA
jgi:hypothetical protein